LPGQISRNLPGAVLFACNMNSIRSPMASALMRHLTNRRVYAKSAGVRMGENNPFAVATMDEMGVDISAHEPVTLSELHDTSFDLIISLTPEAHHQALELTRTMAVDVEYWPTLDPSLASGSREQIMDAYRACRDQLLQKIRARFVLTGGPAV
jgi:protein-tyrosine-phosphatase